ncbi:MAG: carbon-nitrogen family hydrolase [bacterium]|nr:carbon-nitrogen family hydrolase [bacterium]
MAGLLAGVVQVTSGADLEHNLARCSELVESAVKMGAKLVVLPENFAFLGEHETAKMAVAEAVPGDGRILSTMSRLARSRSVDLVLGGLPEAVSATHVHNTSVYIDARGDIRGIYRKIHLFDVAIPDGAVYRESASVKPGGEAVVVDADAGKVGLSICYDLRFPELYRTLAKDGARILTVPAAFTLHTGRDHWHPLLKARAIENLAFVLAAAQYGRHNAKRVTFGHACIIDPWGHVLAEVGDREGVAVAELDFDYQDRLRRELPALEHRRL